VPLYSGLTFRLTNFSQTGYKALHSVITIAIPFPSHLPTHTLSCRFSLLMAPSRWARSRSSGRGWPRSTSLMLTTLGSSVSGSTYMGGPGVQWMREPIRRHLVIWVGLGLGLWLDNRQMLILSSLPCLSLPR